MVMGRSLSVVIDIINVLRSVVKTKNNSPVRAYRYGPKTFQLALELVQSETGQVHMGKSRRCVKRRQNIP